VPFQADGRPVGWVRRDRLPVLAAMRGLLRVAPDTVVLEGATFDDRTERLAAVTAALASAGHVRVHGERYAVAEQIGLPPVALVDRGAAPWFGVAAAGLHVNGFVRDGAAIRMWVAHRARDKPMFPGMLDNMAAGGHPFGVDARVKMREECAEEAGLPDAVSERAVEVGTIHYVVEHDSGLRRDTMVCFGLELPPDVRPRPVDGEVERFELWPLDAVARTVRDTRRFKFNCNLVVIDFLVRHGHIGPDDPDHAAIVAALRRQPSR